MLIIKPHTECVNVAAYSPDGGLIASVSEDGWVKVWKPGELHTGAPLWEKEGDERGISHAQFTLDGKLILTSGWSEHLRAWDAQTGKLRWQVNKPRGVGGVGSLVVSRDGKRVAFAGGWIGLPEKVFVLDLKKRQVERILRGHDDACGALTAGPEGFASGGADRHVRFWVWDSGRCYHDLVLRGSSGDSCSRPTAPNSPRRAVLW